MILRYSLVSVVFFLGMFLSFRAAPPVPLEAHEVPSFAARWDQRVGIPESRLVWMRVDQGQTRREPDIWIRGDRLPAIKGMR